MCESFLSPSLNAENINKLNCKAWRPLCATASSYQNVRHQINIGVKHIKKVKFSKSSK